MAPTETRMTLSERSCDGPSMTSTGTRQKGLYQSRVLGDCLGSTDASEGTLALARAEDIYLFLLCFIYSY